MKADFDILIVGGGLVGASLARALAGSGLRLGLLEAAPPALPAAPGYDDRTLALAYGSRLVFEGIGVWEEIVRRAAPAPIERIHISDRGRFGFTRLSAHDAGVPALGYVVSAPMLGAVLYGTLAAQPDLTLLAPARVEGLAFEDGAARVRARLAEGERELSARLVVAADGADSPLRAAAGLEAHRIDYGQSAVVSAVTPERPHGYTAYERFTESGPLALLPASGTHCAVVWTVAAADVDTVLAWDDATFRAHLEARFGERLGALERVGRRRAYPLALTRVPRQVRPRFVVIGNAAHTVHPVAGQGFNLGLRDVAALAEVLRECAAAGGDPGALAPLERYAAWRTRDNRVILGFTHTLARVFPSRFPPLVLARDLGLIAVDLLPPVKRALVRLTSGLAGRRPRLTLGRALQPPPA